MVLASGSVNKVRPSVCACAITARARARLQGSLLIGLWRLKKRVLIAPVLDQMQECPHRLIGRFVTGDVGIRQQRARFDRRGLPHPISQHRCFRNFGARCEHRFSVFDAVGDPGRTIQHEDRVLLVVTGKYFERCGGTLAARIAKNVDWICARPSGRQYRVGPCHRAASSA